MKCTTKILPVLVVPHHIHFIFPPEIPEILADHLKPDAMKPPQNGERYDWFEEGQDELKIAHEVFKNPNL